MKRTVLCSLLVIALLASGCSTPSNGDNSFTSSEAVESSAAISTPDESEVTDSKPPVIRLTVSKVTISQGEEYDLMDGITAYDSIDGDLTGKIVIDRGNYDPDIPGEYVITYTLSDSSGNAATPKQKKITVRESIIMKQPPIWTADIDGEIKNPQAPAVYGGAWYHKVVSSKDKWVGIETTVTLPEFKIRRYDGAYDGSLAADPAVNNLDNPSVYLGGHALSESDVGLSLSRALIDVKNQTLSTGSIAFRPFWRYITAEGKDDGGYDVHGGEYAVSANGNNCIANYHWRYTEYYYLPGDTLRILVCSPEPDKLQLMIEVIEASTLPSSVEIRKT